MIPLAKPSFGAAEKAAVLEVLESGQLAAGPRVALFEERFAALVGAKHAVAVSSGTTALHVALAAHGIGRGDEVITTPFSFIATTNSILHAGATPVFADIDPVSFNLALDTVERAITPRTRAILLVHLFGLPADLPRFRDLAHRHGLVLIEDAAQAIGASVNNEPIGSTGTACFSLYATKNLSCGEGGMVTTDNEAVAHRCRLLRNHGMAQRYQYECLGFNYRMSDLHAAIGLAQLDRFPQWARKRIENAGFYAEALFGLDTPASLAGRQHAFHQYTLRIPSPDGTSFFRDRVAADLTSVGIGNAIFYPSCIHHLEHVRSAAAGLIPLPEAERASREVLSIPVHPHLTNDELHSVAREVNRACRLKLLH